MGDSEQRLRKPVEHWLISQGFAPLHEIMLFGYCDLVGVKFAKRVGRPIPALLDTVAVELKLSDVAGVIRQAKSNRYCVHASFAAMPADRCDRMLPSTKRKFSDAGVGLLRVDGDEVLITIAPDAPYKLFEGETCRKKWWAKMRRQAKNRERFEAFIKSKEPTDDP